MGNKNCIVVNMFGGPGSGKSTGAAYIFSKLKMADVNCEFISEFAKDKVWEQNFSALDCQPYVFGEQCFRLDRCANQVDCIITDSPLLLSAIYNKDKNIEPEFSKMVVKKFKEYTNLNFFIQRRQNFEQAGRVHDAQQSLDLDFKIKNYLSKNKIKFSEVEGSEHTYDSLISEILSEISEVKKT